MFRVSQQIYGIGHNKSLAINAKSTALEFWSLCIQTLNKITYDIGAAIFHQSCEGLGCLSLFVMFLCVFTRCFISLSAFLLWPWFSRLVSNRLDCMQQKQSEKQWTSLFPASFQYFFLLNNYWSVSIISHLFWMAVTFASMTWKFQEKPVVKV